MLEIPEAITIAKQLNETVLGREVERVCPPTREHKFCWFYGDPAAYDKRARGARIQSAQAQGGHVEIVFDSECRLILNDGVNIRLVDSAEIPRDYQTAILLSNGAALVFTVAMYGGIILCGEDYDNEYYIGSKNAVSPFSNGFHAHFEKTLKAAKPSLTAKGLVATEQRFPGVGNGVLQDILFAARINPRTKISSLSDEKLATLERSMVEVLSSMTAAGGRDTEKDLYGNAGGYKTLMSKNGIENGCPACGGAIVKEAYMGGSVYYCPVCQQRI